MTLILLSDWTILLRGFTQHTDLLSTTRPVRRRLVSSDWPISFVFIGAFYNQPDYGRYQSASARTRKVNGACFIANAIFLLDLSWDRNLVDKPVVTRRNRQFLTQWAFAGFLTKFILIALPLGVYGTVYALWLRAKH